MVAARSSGGKKRTIERCPKEEDALGEYGNEEDDEKPLLSRIILPPRVTHPCSLSFCPCTICRAPRSFFLPDLSLSFSPLTLAPALLFFCFVSSDSRLLFPSEDRDDYLCPFFFFFLPTFLLLLLPRSVTPFPVLLLLFFFFLLSQEPPGSAGDVPVPARLTCETCLSVFFA